MAASAEPDGSDESLDRDTVASLAVEAQRGYGACFMHGSSPLKDDDRKLALKRLRSALLAEGAFAGANGEQLAACLVLSARVSSAECAELCMDAGAAVNSRMACGKRSSTTPLAEAVCAGSLAVVHALTCAGADVLMPPELSGSPQPLLALAQARGHPAVARYLRSYEHRLAAHAADGLARACMAGDGRRARALLQMCGGEGRPMVDATTRSPKLGCRPLHAAARGGHAAMCRFLAEAHRVPVDQEDDKGHTPLVLAYSGGHTDAAAMLLTWGALIDKVSAITGDDALLAAASGPMGSVAATEHAWRAGGGRVLSEERWKALAAASFDEARDEALTSLWADLTALRRRLVVACCGCKNGLAAAVLLLERFGGSLSQDQEQADAAVVASILAGLPMTLAWCLEELGNERVLSVRTSGPACEATGLTMLAAAASLGDTTIVKDLIGAGAAVNEPSGDPAVTPLMLACASGQLATAKELLLSGATAGLAAPFGVRPCMMAARLADSALLEHMLGHAGVTVGDIDDGGFTPLMYAAANASESCLRLLLLRGAAWDCRSNQGSSALDLAVLSGHLPSIELLRSARDSAYEAVVQEFRSAVRSVDDGDKTAVTRLGELMGRHHDVVHMARAAVEESVLELAQTQAAAALGVDTAANRASKMMDLAAIRQLVSGAEHIHAQELALARIIDASGDRSGPEVVIRRIRSVLATTKVNLSAARRSDGASPLCAAASSGSLAVVGELLDLGAAPDSFAMFTGETALMAAARAGRGDVAGLLPHRGASPSRRSFAGVTAGAMAVNPKIAEMLAAAQAKEPPGTGRAPSVDAAAVVSPGRPGLLRVVLDEAGRRPVLATPAKAIQDVWDNDALPWATMESALAGD